ncbi:hypothetical protein RB195_003739 [Necator americanus]|uniref:Hydrolase, TatD family n=1 Tax=Necator americanus TaxID=51031 RepID=A0ABR1DQQ1_NECAM
MIQGSPALVVSKQRMGPIALDDVGNNTNNVDHKSSPNLIILYALDDLYGYTAYCLQSLGEQLNCWQMNGSFGAFRDLLSNNRRKPPPQPFFTWKGNYYTYFQFPPAVPPVVNVSGPKFFFDSANDIKGGSMHLDDHRCLNAKRMRTDPNHSSSRTPLSLQNDSADLPWNSAAGSRGNTSSTLAGSHQHYPADTLWLGQMNSASELECNFDDLPSPEDTNSMSDMCNSNCSETDKTNKSKKKEKPDQPLYVPPNRRKSEESFGKDGSHASLSPKSTSAEVMPTRKHSTLLKNHENIICCSSELLSHSSTDSHDEDLVVSHVKVVSGFNKEPRSDDDLLPRPLAVKKKEARKGLQTCPSGSSESECQNTAVWPTTSSSPLKNGRLTGRLNSRIGFQERKEHTYTDIQTEVTEPFIDSHCHLDFIFKKFGYGGIDDWLLSEPGLSHKKFRGCIPNFIEPSLFAKGGENSPQYDFDWILQQLQSNYVLGATYGCHPHFADSFKDSIHDTLVHLLENRKKSKLLAIGECGLDYMKSDVVSEVQVEVFRAQLALAKEYQIPLVIHCRSGSRGLGDAEKICLSVMNDVGLSRFHNIHRHCFTESWEVAKKWIDAFDNIYFGFTSAVANWEQSAPEKYETSSVRCRQNECM